MLLIVHIFISVVVTLFSVVFYFYRPLMRARKICKWMPQAPRLPLVGSAFEFGDNTETINDIMRLTNNPQKLCYVEQGPIWHLYTTNYNLTEKILSSSSPSVLDKGEVYTYFQPWLGTGLLTAAAAKWKKRRKMITPAFHFAILEQFVEVFEKNSQIMIERLRKCMGNEVDIYEYINACTLDIITESAMGMSVDSQKGENKDYIMAVKEMTRIILTRSFSAIKGIDCLFYFTEDYRIQKKMLQILHGFTNRVVEQRVKELQNNVQKDCFGRRKKMAFLDLLLHSTIDGKPLTQQDVREEVDTFMFEGHDTTSSGITFSCYCLATHPEVQKRVREELKLILGDDRFRPLSYQDLQDMKYLELVIKESMRLYSPVPLITRRANEDIMFEGNTIPKDTMILLLIYAINRDPDYFPDAETFNPDRFLEPNRYPYSYIPFSAGPRNCIGQRFAMLEMKSAIANLLRHFELQTTNPPHKMILTNESILKSINGVKIVLKETEWN